MVGHGGTLFPFFNNSQTLHRKTKVPKGRKIMFHSFTFRYSICITCIYYTHIAMHRHSVYIYIYYNNCIVYIVSPQNVFSFVRLIKASKSSCLSSQQGEFNGGEFHSEATTTSQKDIRWYDGMMFLV